MRYADDFVILARYIDQRITTWTEHTLEAWMGLTLNREKTRVVRLREPGASLDFLGYTFRYNRDLKGRGHRYLNMEPSKASLKWERARLREMTGKTRSHVPLPSLIAGLNRHLRGWSNYYSQGYPRKAMRHINAYARMRLVRHLKRRSQRPWKPKGGKTCYQALADMGLIYL